MNSLRKAISDAFLVAGRHPCRAVAAAAFRSQACDHQIAIVQHDRPLGDAEEFREFPNKLTGAGHQFHPLLGFTIRI